ncbi:hypothetical protein PvNV_011 [Penaeus vannamei nudivirus]|nr:hypothetical protein PvSNPV_011 [Penaeus vannamei nucleopolyhedrovirus]
MESTNEYILNVRDRFSIGGLTPKMEALWDNELKKQIINKIQEILNSEIVIYRDVPPYSHTINNTDIFIIYNEITKPEMIIIAVPNNIKCKETKRSRGIIVCSSLEYYILHNSQWEYQSFDKLRSVI